MSVAAIPQDPLQVTLSPIKPVWCVSGKQPVHVMARVQAPMSASVPRTPLSIALVIDRSGSMSGERLQAAKDAALAFVQKMSDDDCVALVTYDDEVQLALPLMPVQEARHALADVLSRVESGGNTDLHGGWLCGVQTLAQRSVDQPPGTQRMSRVVVLSDGQANHGVVDVTEISSQVKHWADRGVSTSTVGIGVHFNEELMTAMATAGGGNAMYGDSASELAEPFDAEIALLSHLAWRDVRLIMGSATSRWRAMNDYPALDELTWRLPDIANGSEAWMCFEVPTESAIRAQQRSRSHSALHITIEARNALGELHRFKCSLPTLPVVSAEVWAKTEADALVARRLVELLAADIQRKARLAVQRGLWSEAEKLLRHMEELARDNPWVKQVLDQLRELLAQRDSALMAKELHFSALRMSRRLAEVNEGAYESAASENIKASYLRKKTFQGRRTL